MARYDSFIQHLSQVIHQSRKASNLTQVQLAHFAGVGKTAIFDLEHGKTTIQLDTLLKVLDVLNIQLDIIDPLSEKDA